MEEKLNIRQEFSMKHLFDGGDFNFYTKNIVNLSAGAPGPDLLSECSETFQRATEHRLKFELENNSYLFQYGPTTGTNEFRTEMAKFLSRGYQLEVNKSDIVSTSGASNGLHLILSTLLDMNAVIFVDEVTYMIALEAIRQFSSMKIISIPLNSDGPDLQILEAEIDRFKFEPCTNKMFWGLYYTIPTFHNPTGILFSEEINQSLIKVARKNDLLIACDDVYNLLYYTCDKSPKRLFAYDIEGITNEKDFKGNVISNGSFSKILAPGLRVGWMECPPRCVKAFMNSGVLKSGGGTSNYASGIVTSLIQLNLAEKQLKLYSKKYHERMEAMCNTLNIHLPSYCTFLKPQGGYFVWIKFPESFDCNDLNVYCKDNFQVFTIAGTRFSQKSLHNNFMRLTFAFYSTEVLVKSVERFCQAIGKYKKLKKLSL